MTKRKQKAPRQWLGIHFECCRIYTRIYKHDSGDRYEGRCPKCLRMLRVRVGSGGSTQRIFKANFK